MSAEPARPSQVVTRLEISCRGRRISIGWTARSPGLNEIGEIRIDGVRLADDQRPTLARLVADREVEAIRIVQCHEQADAYEALLLIDFGRVSIDGATTHYVSLRLAQGRLTARIPFVRPNPARNR